MKLSKLARALSIRQQRTISGSRLLLNIITIPLLLTDCLSLSFSPKKCSSKQQQQQHTLQRFHLLLCAKMHYYTFNLSRGYNTPKNQPVSEICSLSRGLPHIAPKSLYMVENKYNLQKATNETRAKIQKAINYLQSLLA